MSLLEALLLGLVQGLTEFIPVSSSGHLVLLHDIFGGSNNDLAFDVALHVGTLAAVILFFRQDLGHYIKALFVKSEKTRLAFLLAAATVPAVVAGFLFASLAESAFRSSQLVAFNLIAFGGLMLLAEYWYRRQNGHTPLASISRRQALMIGIAQSLAIVPGVSRSGSTITAAMVLGVDRIAATRFSFLLSVPIITGAAAKTLLSDWSSVNQTIEPAIFAIGVLSAFVSGLFAIKFMLRFLNSHGLEIFAIYRIVFGLIVLLLIGG